MSTVLPARRHVKGVRFHPTDAELINYLKRFFKGQHFSSQCPIQFADIYGDQPPWEIFGASEEKVRYFIAPLKKRKSKHIRFCRTCANGTWKGQTSEEPIRNRRKGTVVGFRRSLTYETKEREQNKTWLMKEYFVADEFFRENNIPKQDYVISRIKRKIKDKKAKDHAVTAMEENDVAGNIEAVLHGPDGNCTTQPAENQVLEEPDQWDSIIDRVCGEQDDVVENTTTLRGEYDNQNTTWSTTSLEQEACDQGANRQTDIGISNEFREAMNGIIENLNAPDDWLQLDDQSTLLLDMYASEYLMC
ncbi:NAC domain-containing protein 2-like [Lycium ferocissimum]|uniref:NAC domain-containing protein 2-like n=1 Tax=Lycium ferocissimum TaxID=112874 RepID=UPI002815635C|nr:NAC domain-containing protein 2-like [Lycium ferocissimum]